MIALRLELDNITNLPDGGPTFLLVEGQRSVDIGRNTYLDWTLPDPARVVSGRHCEIHYRDGGYWLTDISTNGTYLNGSDTRLTEPTQLRTGDRISIGDYLINVTVEGDAGASRAVEAPPPGPAALSSAALWEVSDERAAPAERPEQRRASQSKPVHADMLDWVADMPEVDRSASQPAPDTPTAPSSPDLPADPYDVPAVERPAAPAPADVQTPASSDPFDVPATQEFAAEQTPVDTFQGSETDAPAPDDPAPTADDPPPIAQLGIADDRLSAAAFGIGEPEADAVQPPVDNEPADTPSAWGVDPSPSEPLPSEPLPSEPPPSAPVERDPPATGRATGGALGADTGGFGGAVADNAPAAPAPVGPEMERFVTALANALDLPQDRIDAKSPEALAETIGTFIHLSIDGMQRLLKARAASRGYMKTGPGTQVQAIGNNPLKFMPTPGAAADVLFGPPSRSYLNVSQTLEESFADLGSHQVALYSAMQDAVERMLADLDPDAIEIGEDTDRGFGIPGMSSRKGRFWDTYKERYKARASQHDKGMVDVFMMFFSDAYGRAIDKS